MTDALKRYGRQIRLAEVGEAGQARLSSSVAVLGGDGLAGMIERRYLERAGVAVREASDSVPCPPRVHARAESADVAALGLRHPAARELAEGALRALFVVRAVVLDAAGNAP